LKQFFIFIHNWKQIKCSLFVCLSFLLFAMRYIYLNSRRWILTYIYPGPEEFSFNLMKSIQEYFEGDILLWKQLIKWCWRLLGISETTKKLFYLSVYDLKRYIFYVLFFACSYQPRGISQKVIEFFCFSLLFNPLEFRCEYFLFMRQN